MSKQPPSSPAKSKAELSSALRANMQRRKAVASKPGTHRPPKRKGGTDD